MIDERVNSEYSVDWSAGRIGNAVRRNTASDTSDAMSSTTSAKQYTYTYFIALFLHVGLHFTQAVGRRAV